MKSKWSNLAKKLELNAEQTTENSNSEAKGRNYTVKGNFLVFSITNQTERRAKEEPIA